MTTTHPDLAPIRRRSRTRHHVGHLEFQPLSTNEWRIVDSRQTPGTVEALVGFVAWHSGAFDATRLTHPLESVPFASLEAVAAFVGRPDSA